MFNKFVSEAYIEGQTERTSLYHGYLHPYSYGLPYYAGGLSSIYNSEGLGTIQYGNLAGGLNGSSTIPGVGTIDSANAYLLVSIAAIIINTALVSSDIYATVEISSTAQGQASIIANIKALADVISTIVSQGDVTGDVSGALNFGSNISASGLIDSAIGNMVASIQSSLLGESNINVTNVILALNAAANVVGTGNVTGAITALGNLVSTLEGNGTLNTATIKALANLVAEITPFTELSPQNIAINV